MALQFNNETYDCPDIRFYFNGNYTTPPNTSLVVSILKSDGWYVLYDKIKITNQHTLQMQVGKNFKVLN